MGSHVRRSKNRSDILYLNGSDIIWRKDAKWQDLQICKIFRHMDRDRKAEITNAKGFTWDSIYFFKKHVVNVVVMPSFSKII